MKPTFEISIIGANQPFALITILGRKTVRWKWLKFDMIDEHKIKYESYLQNDCIWFTNFLLNYYYIPIFKQWYFRLVYIILFLIYIFINKIIAWLVMVYHELALIASCHKEDYILRIKKSIIYQGTCHKC